MVAFTQERELEMILEEAESSVVIMR